MNRFWHLLLIAGLALGACTGLQQFPDASTNYGTVLPTLDKYYDQALKDIYADGVTVDDQKSIRNELIERRLAVVDAYFADFVSDLAKESATAGFGVALVEVAVGGVGSLVAESASQILSAVSGGLAGAKAAYDKTVLYEKTISALIAQMQAGRKTIAAQILTRWSADLETYPLWMAKRDLDAYEFAGSIPGAIMGTAADAKVKDDQAEAILQVVLPKIGPEAVTETAFQRREALEVRIDGLDGEKAQALVTQMKTAFPAIVQFADAQYPAARRAADTDGETAKKLLKRMMILTATLPADLDKWETAVDGLS